MNHRNCTFAPRESFWLAILLVFCLLPQSTASAVIGGSPDTTSSNVVVGFARSSNLNSPYCSGVLVSSTWVLTAAHCVVDESGSLGFWLTSTVIGTSEGLRGNSSLRSVIRGVVPHPSYSPATSYSDIALVQVDSVFGGASASIATAEEVTAFEAIASNVTNVGFGRISQNGPTSSTALEVQATIWPSNECQKQWPYRTKYVSEFVCSKGTITNTVCNGDSGGPMFVTIGGQRKLVGILSFGAVTCGYSITVHSRVASYRSFLEQYGIGRPVDVVPEIPGLPTPIDPGVVPELPALPVFETTSNPTLPKFTVSRIFQLILTPRAQNCAVYVDGPIAYSKLRTALFSNRRGGKAIATRNFDQFGDATFNVKSSCTSLRKSGIYLQLEGSTIRTEAVE